MDAPNKSYPIYPTRKFRRIGGNPLSESGIYRIFKNQFYAGMISYRKEWHKGRDHPQISGGRQD